MSAEKFTFFWKFFYTFELSNSKIRLSGYPILIAKEFFFKLPPVKSNLLKKNNMHTNVKALVTM